jgi:hypothetical protein
MPRTGANRGSVAAAGYDDLGRADHSVTDAVAFAQHSKNSLIVELRAGLVLKRLVLPGVVEGAQRLDALDTLGSDQISQRALDSFDLRGPLSGALFGWTGQESLKVVQDREQANDEIDSSLGSDLVALSGYFALVSAEVLPKLAEKIAVLVRLALRGIQELSELSAVLGGGGDVDTALNRTGIFHVQLLAGDSRPAAEQAPPLPRYTMPARRDFQPFLARCVGALGADFYVDSRASGGGCLRQCVHSADFRSWPLRQRTPGEASNAWAACSARHSSQRSAHF